MKFNAKIMLACSLLGLTASAGIAQEVSLRLGTHIAAAAPGVVEGTNVFAENVAELSGGEVNVQVFPGEQAGKVMQMMDLVQAGAVDIGVLTSALVSGDRLPLFGLLELPGIDASLCDVSDAVSAMSEPGQVIYENDLAPNGIRILAVWPYPPYGPAASRKEITNIEDLQGMRLRNAGGLMEYSVVALGGVPVRMPSPEVYQSLQRGTIDAVLFSFLSVKSFDLSSVADFGTTGFSFGTPGDLLIISENRFQSLSPEQQEALLEAGRRTSKHWCEHVTVTEKQDLEEMRAAGMSIHTWSPEQVEQLTTTTQSVTENWVKTLEERGQPGGEALETFHTLLAE